MSSDQPQNSRARSYRALAIIALVLAVALFLAYRQGLWRNVGAGPAAPPTPSPAVGEEPAPSPLPTDVPPTISRLAVSYDRPDGNWRAVFRRLTVWAEAPGADEVVFMLAPTGSDETGREVGRATRQSQDQSRFSAMVDLGSGASTFHLWAVARGPGGEARSDILDLIYDGDRPEPDKIEGVPLYPGFHWHMGALTGGQKADLAAAFGQDFARGAQQMAFTDWLWDADPDALQEWYLKTAQDQGGNSIVLGDSKSMWSLSWHEGATVVTIRLAGEEAAGAAGGGTSHRYRLLLTW